MSDAHPPVNHDPHDMPHEGPIKTPKQLILAVLFAFIIPIVLIILLAVYVNEALKPGAGADVQAPEAVAERIRPVGVVDVRDLTDPSSMKSGEQVYTAQCAACHGAGAAGAPKLGDESAWGPRVKTGYEALLHSALQGKGSMGPQGGGTFTDFEIGRAVVYMANHAGGKLAEPQMAAASAPEAAAASK